MAGYLLSLFAIRLFFTNMGVAKSSFITNERPVQVFPGHGRAGSHVLNITMNYLAHPHVPIHRRHLGHDRVILRQHIPGGPVLQGSQAQLRVDDERDRHLLESAQRELKHARDPEHGAVGP
jgi:hypothetical protein